MSVLDSNTSSSVQIHSHTSTKRRPPGIRNTAVHPSEFDPEMEVDDRFQNYVAFNEVLVPIRDCIVVD